MWGILIAVVFQLDTAAVYEEPNSFYKVFYSQNDLKEWVREKYSGVSLEETADLIDVLSTMSDDEYKILLNQLNQSPDDKRIEILKQIVDQILYIPKKSFQQTIGSNETEEEKKRTVSFVETATHDLSFSHTMTLDKKILLDFATRIFPSFLLNEQQEQEEALSILGRLWIQFGESHLENAAFILKKRQDYIQGTIMTQIALLKTQIEHI